MNSLGKHGYPHLAICRRIQSIPIPAGKSFSLLKRGIIGTWHKISAKHLESYLNEKTFRFNRRKNSDLFVDTLRHMVTAPVLTFEKLTA